MDAVILAGGLGTRLRAVTGDLIPKALAPVNGYPFAAHLISCLYRMGVRNFFFSTGHMADMVGEWWNTECPVNNMTNAFFYAESKPCGTGGGLLNVLKTYGTIMSDPFLVVNGDCMVLPVEYDTNLERYYEHARRNAIVGYRPCDVMMFTTIMPNDGRYGEVVTHETTNAVVGFNAEGKGKHCLLSIVYR
jgi:D-glycero-alpha-D-manno-heptose 1-phosphate guanylyltransferase